MSEGLRLLFRFIVLFIIQLFILNQIQWSGLAKPFIYIFFLFFLPMKWKPWVVLMVCFLTGAVMDVFSNTFGLHAAACSLIGFIRPFVYRLTTPQYDFDDEVLTDVHSRTFTQFVAYNAILSTVFCLAYFILQGTDAASWSKILLWILISSVLTFGVILMYRYIFVSRVRKRRLS